MARIKLIEQNKLTDCDLFIGNLENTLLDFEHCLDVVIDDRKTKMNVVGSIFGFGKSLAKLTLNVTGCAIKNVPKAVVAVAAVKREIITELENEYNQYQKELKEEALNKKIKQLHLKAKKIKITK